MPKLVVHNHLPRPSGPRRPKGSGPNFGRPCANQVSRGADDLRNKGFCLAEVGGPAKEMMDCSRNAPHATVWKDLQAELCLVASLFSQAAATTCTRVFSLCLCWLLPQMLSSSLWSRSQNIVRACFGGRCKASVLLPGQTHRKTKDGPRVCLTLPRPSRLHSRKTVRCSLRPQFSSIHGRVFQTHGFRQLRKPACRIALQLRILMGLMLFALASPVKIGIRFPGHRNRMVFRGRTGCQRRWCELGLLRPQGEKGIPASEVGLQVKLHAPPSPAVALFQRAPSR